MLWTILAVIAVVTTLALGFYAGRLMYQLKLQTARHQAARDKRIGTITESILTISMAMEQQQCELSEGVIRIVNLLNALPVDPKPDYRAKFPHLHDLFVAVSGFAILDERKKLSKAEKRKQDKAREQIESEHESQVLAELPAVKEYCHAL
ncbi:DUF2489 domain-containing protein [Alteromonas sp. ASW11-19]|uniref:DUF2489 domain-containing protein n=1 Tax=Alteromonas salexigens TaxID=2982530 RepID=A0ABT2VK31_9ALTE|nr:DUF2489 domain-containing protein [Alteromonas salexigens]MCU7553627.1 DUF2489 domain-containing protein [Alteromonas salexigens]